MSGFYRLEFVKGPHDGLAVEGNTLIAPRLQLPTPAAAEGCAAMHNPASVYELSQQALRWEQGAPQAVLRYEFRGPLGSAGNPGRLARWLGEGRHRFARWLMAPVGYPMTTRLE
jgi:hypothetical protein